jgi:acyl-CoA synthetase (NDP forming)
MIIDICEQGSGAKIISLVAGGIGDGADHENLADDLKTYLKLRLKNNLWVPRIIGPNSLGTILSPLNFNSLFIPENNLKVKFHPHGNMAFISQSGAFFITRLSNSSELPLKYAFCIGNQLDLGLPEILTIVDGDPEIKVVSLYIEGFRSSDLRAIEREIKKLKKQGKQVVIYKGGRSKEGAKAAAGHTGAIAGLYDLESTVLKNSGAFVCDSIEEFERRSEFLSKYEKFNHNIDKVGVISNAGFETVCSADNLKDHLVTLSHETKKNLNEFFHNHSIDHLISASNPLDLTPMADEAVYAGAIGHMIGDVELLVVSIVPQTEKLSTGKPEMVNAFVKKLKSIENQFKVPIVIVVDSGEIFDGYRQIFLENDFIVLSAIEKVRYLF